MMPGGKEDKRPEVPQNVSSSHFLRRPLETQGACCTTVCGGRRHDLSYAACALIAGIAAFLSAWREDRNLGGHSQ